jgi:hypothetical protein
MRIHFIEKDNRLVDLGESIYESGFWKVGEETARSLKGGLIYFHERQDTPSFFGGEILDYRIQRDGPYANRIIFKFKYLARCKYVRAGLGGWSQEMKLVRDT